MIRVALCRVLLSWWIIIVLWVVILPVLYLGTGNKDLIELCAEFTEDIWSGDIK